MLRCTTPPLGRSLAEVARDLDLGEGVLHLGGGAAETLDQLGGAVVLRPRLQQVQTDPERHQALLGTVVQITFDPSKISLDQLLRVFFLVAHDPTELDRQGPDDGSQYRSVVFYADGEQKQAAFAAIKHLEDAKTFGAPIVTQVVPFKAFYPAEAYHQHFVQDHPDYPYVVFNDLPKLKHLREEFPQLVKR